VRLILICIYIFLSLSLYGQGLTLVPNTCDSSVLTKSEFEKCMVDTNFNNDIIARTNYITFLKTELLPKYRLIRNSLLLTENLKRKVKILKVFYDSTLDYKKHIMTLEMDRNQNYIQPKAYLTTLLAIETFKIYPDLYAILLNPIHVVLKPQSDYIKIIWAEEMVDDILTSMTVEMKREIQQLVLEMSKKRKAFTKEYFYDMFQGDVVEEKRSFYNVVNFLLWTE
jgi:hypothetical protein